MSRYVIIGAGAVGATTAAQLHLAGTPVVVVARGANLAALRARGLRYHRPDGEHRVDLPVVGGPGELALTDEDILVLATKTQDADAALAQWAWQPVGAAVAAAVLPVLTTQNGFDAERSALRRFATVFGGVAWSPAGHLVPGEVVSPAAPTAGVFWAGVHPTGRHPRLDEIAATFGKADLALEVVDDLAPWKAGKLISILGNALDALYPPGDERDRLAEAVRDEGRAVLAAAGFRLADLRAETTLDLSGFVVRPVPGHDRGGASTWQSLARGASVETEYLNGEIALLARLHGIPAPLNEALVAKAAVAAATGSQPRTGDITELAALHSPQG